MKRGIYLIADTPTSAMPLAVEDGSGDKMALIEALKENLTRKELSNLRTHLPEDPEQ